MKTKIFSLVLLLVAFVGITSCGDDEVGTPALNRTNITLYVGETATLKYSGGRCTWTSDNPLVASVEAGVVRGEHVGTTIIHANDLTCAVTVKPSYTSVFEPCMKWGANQSEVQQYMSGYTLYSSTDSQQAYEGKWGVREYLYSFENGGLSESLFVTNVSVDLIYYLAERYVVLDSSADNSVVYMATIDLKTGIKLIMANTEFTVIYAPMSAQSAKAYSPYTLTSSKVVWEKVLGNLSKRQL